ncbi:MAG: hypothetical protein Q7S65_02160 [Nanoarchaeota archaeon]|nr:hypothetical protein [Nanoarchaeota archaeon]
MKIMISLLSAVVVFLGVAPLVHLKFIPSGGIGYSVVLALLGVLIVVAGFVNNLLVGLEKFVVIMQGALVLLLGLLRWLPTFLAFIPREGTLFPIVVIVVGGLGLVYGLFGMA